MSFLSLPQALIDSFELRVLLDLGDGTVERSAVAFVLPVGHILGHFVGVSHQSPRAAQGSGGLGWTGFGPRAGAYRVAAGSLGKARADVPFLLPPASLEGITSVGKRQPPTSRFLFLLVAAPDLPCRPRASHAPVDGH